MRVTAPCQTHEHIAQFYENDDFLADVVAEYLLGGARAGERLLVALTAPRLAAVTERLDEQGLNTHDAIAAGQLTVLDAHTTLDAIMCDGMPDAKRFERYVLGALPEDSDQRPVRVYGELVNVLCGKDQHQAAIRLEQLWDDAGAQRPLTLLCAYSLAHFQHPEDRHAFQRICSGHSRVLPAEGYSRLEDPDERLCLVALLQQRARALEHEIGHRATLERAISDSQRLCHAMLTELADHANHDELTGLTNRQHAQNRLAELIASEADNERKVAVLHIDIDQLKAINDSLGLDMGDYYLRQTAQRIMRGLRKGQVVSRLGSDEMLAVLPGLEQAAEVRPIVERLLACTNEPVELAGQEVFASCSIGISLFPDHGRTVHELIRNASLAMRHAQRLGRGQYHVFTPALLCDEPDRTGLNAALREALPRGEMELYYQPLICARSGQVVAVEALPRWASRQFGPIESMRLIHAAEEAGQIAPIGQWVLERVCRQGKAWLDSGFGLRVTVNISTTQLLRDDIANRIGEALASSGLPGEMLEIELTESVLMSDPWHAGDILQRLKTLGVRLAVDEFGSGHSILTHFHRFPFDTLKIDRSFIGGSIDNAHHQAIIRSVIVMAHQMGMDVTASGVETRKQADYLRQEGCDILQGSLWAPLEYRGDEDENDVE